MTVQAAGPSNELLELDVGQAVTLYEVGKMVTASSDLEVSLEAIAEAAHQLTCADMTSLAVVEVDGSLVMRVGRGAGHPPIGQAVDIVHGAVARALRERQPALVDNLSSEGNGAQAKRDMMHGFRTVLAVPLIWYSETLGVMTVGFRTPHAVGARDVALLVALAEQAAAAVRHARDYAEARHLHEESQAMSRQLSEQAAQLERVQHQLIENEKLTAIGQLVQGLAHEMNSPLSVVITNLSVLGSRTENLLTVTSAAQVLMPQLLADPLSAALAGPLQTAINGADLEYTAEDLPELLTDSTAAVRRLAELVRSMANFAQRDTGGPGAVIITDVLEAALTLASNPLKQCARIIRTFEPAPPVLGLTSELTELFLHLLINSAQALEERAGTVAVSTSSTGGTVSISIHDTGRGIAAEDLPRVFDPFYTTRPVGGGGTGMGLAVCRAIVARHHGSIAIDSHAGAGTTVTVQLPAAG